MKNDPMSEDDDSGFSSYGKAIRTAGPLFTAGIQLAVAVCGMGLFGYLADNHFHTTPWLMVGGLFIGAGGGLYLFIKTVISLDTPNQAANKDRSGRAD